MCLVWAHLFIYPHKMKPKIDLISRAYIKQIEDIMFSYKTYIHISCSLKKVKNNSLILYTSDAQLIPREDEFQMTKVT